MFDNTKALFLLCETPLHAGSGSDLGIVDLPIQRERHTSFPKIEASSLKGALRNALEDKIANLKTQANEPEKLTGKSVIAAFGSDNTGEQAGALAFTDARLLLFPVKSMKGVFAWVTCPRVLSQFEKDMKLVSANLSFPKLPTGALENQKCYILGDASDVVFSGKVVLEEYAFSVTGSMSWESESKTLIDTLFAHNEYLKKKANSIVVLNDDDFKDFVNLSTEVITRIKINNATGTVANGQLFTEEYLPSESVLYSVVFANPEFGENKEGVTAKTATEIMTIAESIPSIIQCGGNATLGKGILRLVFNPNPKSKN